MNMYYETNEAPERRFTIGQLNEMYHLADNADSQLFQEMRSNVLLTAGDQYFRKGLRDWTRYRSTINNNEDVRIKVTKNHLSVIVKRYVNSITTYTPGIHVQPKNQAEIHDQKKAELHQAIWSDARARHDVDNLFTELCNDFVEIGECHLYIYWDPNKGPLTGYEPMLDDMGHPMMDELGQPMPNRAKPVAAGDFCFDRIYGFNILRQPEAESFEQSEYMIVRKMASINNLKKVYAKDPDKLAFIQQSGNRTFRIFDGVTGAFRDARETECMLRCFYWRPCVSLPRGWYSISTEMGILEEGELPFGVWPLVSQRLEQIATTPRGRSIIKQLRPYQAEINRAGSKIAEHQITLGDDKLVFQGNAKISSGGFLPGVRGVSVNGAQPIHLPGRTGEQYFQYVNDMIGELYRVADLEYNELSSESGQTDPYTLLFKSASQRKRFRRYTDRFSYFQKKAVETYFKLAKKYMPEDQVILAIGKTEQVNIAEFKTSDEAGWHLQIEPSNDDVETRLGKQIIMSQILQYAGGQIPPEAIGQVIRAMPYANVEQAVDTLTLNYDSSQNLILALDRGEAPYLSQYDDPVYIMSRLTGRMRKSDFRFLPQEVQAAYAQVMQQYAQLEAQKRQQVDMANAGMIPDTGPMVKADVYTQDPSDPSKVTRATIPQDALQWLIDRLAKQGVVVMPERQLPLGAQAEISQGGMVNG